MPADTGSVQARVRSRVVILHNAVGASATADERDVLSQVEAVSAVLRPAGHEIDVVAAELDLAAMAMRLRALQPELVVNLVESLDGSGRLIHLVPALLERMNLKFTGAPADAMYLTSNKLLARRLMNVHGLPTPSAITALSPVAGALKPAFAGTDSWIIKSVWEDASFGLDDESVVTGRIQAGRMIARRSAQFGGEWFAEEFLPGREFNVSMLADETGPRVLPPAEIRFVDFPPGKPRLVGYSAKWQTDSFEYRNTPRSFLRADDDSELAATLGELSRRCWHLFGLRGYARVDFRLDESGRPLVLEVNANPCLSADAGFAAALEQAGIPFAEAVQRLVRDARGFSPVRAAPANA